MRTIKLVRFGDTKQRRCEAVVFRNGRVVAEFFNNDDDPPNDGILITYLITYPTVSVFISETRCMGYKPYFDSDGLVARSTDRA